MVHLLTIQTTAVPDMVLHSHPIRMDKADTAADTHNNRILNHIMHNNHKRKLRYELAHIIVY